ncbi:hypothetical protein [Actinoplanes sp. NPDC051851]|uniref:hypothetical protein n=1 Tax=Actinoplanes sp. NPDC051851 TaxID=3154753 RepID=UPI0034284CCF
MPDYRRFRQYLPFATVVCYLAGVVALLLAPEHRILELPAGILAVAGFAIGVTQGSQAAGRLRESRLLPGRPPKAAPSIPEPAFWDKKRLAASVDERWALESVSGLRFIPRLPVRWTVRETGEEGSDAAALAELLDGTTTLLITGAPGAGKSTLLAALAMHMLRRREERPTPLPVLLNLACWDPVRISFDDWAAAETIRQYPVISPESAGPLLVDREIRLMLDGLDEMSDEARPSALTAISMSRTGQRPLVIAGREIRPAGRTALVVEIQPLAPGLLAEVLDRLPAAARQRWLPVRRRLEAGDPTLAEVFATPLTFKIALQVYADPESDPAALLRFGTPEEACRHLLDGYPRAAYRAPGLRRWNPVHAERWLRFLATRLTRLRTHVLTWHTVLDETPIARLRAATGLLVLALLAVPAVRLAGPLPGIGAAAGLMAGLALLRRPHPAARVLGAALAGGGLWTVLSSGGISSSAISDGAGISGGDIGDGGGNPLVTVIAVLVVMVVLAALPVRPDRLRDEALLRAAVVVAALAAASLAVLATVPDPGLARCASTAVLVAAAAPAAFRGTRWGDLTTAVAWQAARGRLPWRLTAFLEDAEYRLVLRRRGDAYVFGNGLMRDRLAGTDHLARSGGDPLGVRALMRGLDLQTAELVSRIPIRAGGDPG